MLFNVLYMYVGDLLLFFFVFILHQEMRFIMPVFPMLYLAAAIGIHQMLPRSTANGKTNSTVHTTTLFPSSVWIR